MNEPDIHERIGRVMEHFGLNYRSLAQKLDTSDARVGNIIKGVNNPSYDFIESILQAFPEVSPAWLVSGEGQMLRQNNTAETRLLTVTVDKSGEENIVQVPVRAAAGYLDGYNDEEYISQLPAYYLPDLPPGYTYREFECEGDSMAPTLHARDRLICSYVERPEHIQDYYIHVVVSQNEGIVVKRLRKADGALELISDNSFYKPYRLPFSDIKEVWKVRRVITAQLPSPTAMDTRLANLENTIQRILEKLDK